MAATREELDALKRAFENQHSDAARALADLLLVGNITLESHGMLEHLIGESFQTSILALAKSCGVTHQQLGAAVEALGALRITIAELDSLPE